MKRNILSYINKLQAYGTAIKNLHWNAANMSEHKLLDEIGEELAKFQDEIAEIAQGEYGKIKNNELRPRRYNITSSKKMLADLYKDTQIFYSGIKRGNGNIGLRSETENMLGLLSKYRYLLDFCLKEDVKRDKVISEALNKSIKLLIDKRLK